MKDAAHAAAGAARPVWVRPLLAVAGWAFTLVLVLWFFPAAKMILLGVIAASAMAAALLPLRDRIPGKRWVGAILAGAVPILVFVGLVVLLGWLMAGPIKEQIQGWPKVQERINGLLSGWTDRLGIEQSVTVQTVATEVWKFLSNGGAFSATASVLSGFLIALVFVFFGSIYLLTEREERLLCPALVLLPTRRQDQLRSAIDWIAPKLRWWLIGTLISMTVTGVAAWFGFMLAGLEMAAPLAVLAGISEVVPTVGPATAFLVAALFAATQGTGTMIGVVVVYCLIQLLESYVLLPYVMKQAVRIPPVVTLFSVVLWGKVFGAPGLLLAIPIDIVIWGLVTHLLPHHGEGEAAGKAGAGESQHRPDAPATGGGAP